MCSLLATAQSSKIWDNSPLYPISLTFLSFSTSMEEEHILRDEELRRKWRAWEREVLNRGGFACIWGSYLCGRICSPLMGSLLRTKFQTNILKEDNNYWNISELTILEQLCQFFEYLISESLEENLTLSIIIKRKFSSSSMSGKVLLSLLKFSLPIMNYPTHQDDLETWC